MCRTPGPAVRRTPAAPAPYRLQRLRVRRPRRARTHGTSFKAPWPANVVCPRGSGTAPVLDLPPVAPLSRRPPGIRSSSRFLTRHARDVCVAFAALRPVFAALRPDFATLRPVLEASCAASDIADPSCARFFSAAVVNCRPDGPTRAATSVSWSAQTNFRRSSRSGCPLEAKLLSHTAIRRQVQALRRGSIAVPRAVLVAVA